MKQRLPRRRLIDWTPEDGDGQEWLAKLAAEGWVPEHRTGADTVVNGRRVRRFAMIERGEDSSLNVLTHVFTLSILET